MHYILLLLILFYGAEINAQVIDEAEELTEAEISSPNETDNEPPAIEDVSETISEMQNGEQIPESETRAENAPMAEERADSNVEEEPEEAPEPEPEVIYEVFSPHFMKSLNRCKPDTEEQVIDGEIEQASIIEKKENLCHLYYAGFNMYVPIELLSGIHGFAELRTLLKNQDITQYEFTPQYTYDGLLYALEACSKRVDYAGEQIVEQKNEIAVSRALYSEFVNNICSVYLESKMSIDGDENDYTIVCTLQPKILQSLLSFYEDILAKYGAKREFGADGRIRLKSAEQNEETQQADAELMYYLQQKGFCLRPEL